MLHGALSELLRECVCLSHILLPYSQLCRAGIAGAAREQQGRGARGALGARDWGPGGRGAGSFLFDREQWPDKMAAGAAIVKQPVPLDKKMLRLCFAYF